MSVKLTPALAEEYACLFETMRLRPERMREIEQAHRRISVERARTVYRSVEQATGVPWFLVGIIHSLEASNRFDCHLHNGDPLAGPTRNVPKNRPSSQRRAYAWVESAVDALRLKKLDRWTDWTVPGIAYTLERYNGMGYRMRYPHIKSPYLWSFSTVYTCGKYVADRVFSPEAVSRQCGGLTILRYMLDHDREVAARFRRPDPPAEPGPDEWAAPFPWVEGPEGEPPVAAPAGSAPPFPGRYLTRGLENDPDVAVLQRRLHELRADPGSFDGDFGEITEWAVKLFQARSSDLAGEPLEVDGVVGPQTWGALFGAGSIGNVVATAIGGADEPVSSLSDLALAIAAEEVGTREAPLGSNRGPRVDQYIRAAGLDPTGRHAWCMCFVYWCFAEAAERLGVRNPVPRHAGVHLAWQASRRGAGDAIRVVTAAEAARDPSRVRPGMVFFIDTGGSRGHVGLVAANVNGALETIEGNTNDGGSREGIGVFRRSRRRVHTISLGFAGFG
jgi:lysozyme family protein